MVNASIRRFSQPVFLIPSVVLGVMIGLIFTISDYDWQGFILVGAVLGLIAFFIIHHLARQRDDVIPVSLLVIALLLKFGFAMLRHWTDFTVYQGVADAYHYSSIGNLVAQDIWHFHFGDAFSYLKWGTSFIGFFTGVVYAFIGPSILGGYLVYAFLAFLGSYLFYRAFRLALPNGNKWLYLTLIFFFPSVLWWPNGIGKDALIFLWLGVFAYGGAQIFQNRLQGIFIIAIGMVGILWIRPHIAAMSIGAFLLAFLLPKWGKHPMRIAALVLLLIVGGGVMWLLLPQIASYVGVDQMSVQALVERFQSQQVATSGGGSAFAQPGQIINPTTYPLTLITLLFRPFPWESNNLLALVQSFEGVLLLGVVLWRIKSLGMAVLSSIENVYIRYILIYSIVFILFSSIVANFGILARERLMYFPLFFMLISFTPFNALRTKSPDLPI